MTNTTSISYVLSALVALGALSPAVHAGDRLLATGGVTQVEGSAGGGLMPWAVISGYGTDKQVGGSAFYTHAETKADYKLNSAGISLGFVNRVEVSAAQTRFGLGDTVPGKEIRLNTLGVKLRLIGDAIYDQDSWMPQISVGAQYKYNENYDLVPKSLGAKDRSGVDYYVAASKLFLGAANGYNLLVNANLHATKANQFGLLGFGGDRRDSYRIYPAVSAAVMLSDSFLVGTELRFKPDNLSAAEEKKAQDIFLTWFPHRNVSVTGAYIDLGTIATKENQTGWYLSGQFNY
ncbi:MULTISPECIES: DUF3034 family protein [unclassified Methylophilus]|uniref:DUF3034 family protein n=1 Tax=unclassified Methylophilus TaxID=2630143 RepID=UPI0009E74F93|nr:MULTISPECIES: DUF3034 family protein [unclassified Methylophilus]